MRNLLCILLGGLILISQAGIQAQPLTSDQEVRIQQLEKVIQQQEQRLQQLQQTVQTRETEVVREYANSPATQEPLLTAGYENGSGFFVRTADAKFEIFLSGYLQMGLAIFENDTPDNNTFYPNGISLAFDVYMLENWHGRIQLNFHRGYDFAATGGGAAFDGIVLRDAYIEYMWCRDNPVFNVRVGQTHVPFSMAGQYGETQGITIWSEPYIAGWSHGRDPGFMIWGRIEDMFEYYGSIHNGDGQNNLNHTDDFLMAMGFRIYPFRYKGTDAEKGNPNTFFHVGFMRSRNAEGADNGSGNVNAATLATPWGRRVFGNYLGGDNGSTRGWLTGVDTAFRYDVPMDKNALRAELEFMYMVWERKLTTGRLPFLQGYGITFGISYRMNMNPDIEGEGIWPLFQFSYSDVDNKSTDDLAGNIPGQRVFTYTAGVGYSFNSHISVAFNWVVVNLDQMDGYGTTAARNDRADGSDDLEHAWFLQVTAQW